MSNIEKIGKVIEIIRAQHRKNGEFYGIVTCPECGKDIKYSIAQSNGHIHARCEGEDCVRFMM